MFLLVDKEINGLHVAVAVKQQTVGAQAIPPGTTDLLIIGLNILRHVVVYHKAHVRLVDAHAKRDGGYNDVHIIPDKGLLVGRAFSL